VEAPVGTIAVMLVVVQFVASALVPLSEIVLLPCEDPKFVPVRVTAMPTGPEVGDMLVIVGAWACASQQDKKRRESARKKIRFQWYERIIEPPKTPQCRNTKNLFPLQKLATGRKRFLNGDS
jgi:hypothetical protein